MFTPLRPPDMQNVRRLLIVKLSSIGDIVHALPVSAALSRAFPHLELTWIVEEMSAPMVLGNPFLKEVIVLPSDWRKRRSSTGSMRRFREIRADLHRREFDVTLDLQGLSKSGLIAWASGARYRYGTDWLREIAPAFVRRVPRQPESVHIVDQMLDMAAFLGAPRSPVEFPIHIPEEESAAAKRILGQAGIEPGTDYIVINPSSGGGMKGWGSDRFAALADALSHVSKDRLVLVGSRADDSVAGEIIQSSSAPLASIVGKTNLKQLAAILKGARLHIAGDTGSAHIAAGLGVPVVSIFGRTDPARLAPYGYGHLALHHRDRCAGPCLSYHAKAPLNSPQKCLAPPPRCLREVSVDEVLGVALRALGTADG